MLTLWDLLKPSPPEPPVIAKPPQRPKPRRPGPRMPDARGPRPDAVTSMRNGAMRLRYAELAEEMKQRYGIRVRKWRSNSSGCAWEVHYADGTVSRLVEAPYPRGPMSCAIFLHEIGHHAIGLRRYRPRCLEEYHAWRWALETMRERGFNVTPAVERRMAESLRYAVRKARRRGLKRLPAELAAYLD
jgi:hypothetical protein